MKCEEEYSFLLSRRNFKDPGMCCLTELMAWGIFLIEYSLSIKKSIIFSDVLAFPLSLMYHIIQSTFYDWEGRNVLSSDYAYTSNTKDLEEKSHLSTAGEYERP